MGTEIDFNTPPYFDDYDEDKRYYRVVFRPSTAVQARELTQLQTILQKQIERFGNHTFKDGTIVTGCPITYFPNVHYISLADNFTTNTQLFVTDFDSNTLVTNSTDSNNAVRATIRIAKSGIAASFPETNRLYLNYIATGKNGANDVNIFAPGDTLYFYSNLQSQFGTLSNGNIVDSIATLASNGSFTSNGYAYLIGVGDGVIFQKGFFQKVDPHTITVRDFTTNVTNYVVGFDTNESIVDENEDVTLVDNSLGYSNENAPGAHRLKLTPTLVSKARSDVTNNSNFFAIVEFDNSEPVQQYDKSEYDAAGEIVARRTYEESGDYVTIPFNVESRNHESNSQSFYYEISPGVGYVRGNRVETIALTKLEAPRGIDTGIVENQFVTANYGNYVLCDEFLGTFDTEQLSEVLFYDAAQNAISEYESISTAPTGSEVGRANVRAVVFETGTKGAPSAVFAVYLFNIRMNSGKSFSNDVKSLYSTGGTFGNFKADVVLENDLAVLKEGTKSSLVFDTGLTAVKRLTNNTGIGDTVYTYTQVKSGTMSANGNVTITIDTAGPGVTNEKLTHTTGSVLTGALGSAYTVTLAANAYTANLTGTMALNTGNVAIVGTGTSFTTDLTVNTNILIWANSSVNHVRRIATIANNTYLTLDASIAATNTSPGCNFARFFVGGTPINLSSVTINSNTSFTGQLGSNIDASKTVYCTYPVYRNQAAAIPKVINKNRFVKIDCSNNAANTVGPWILGVPDLHKIRHIYVGTTYANTNADRLDWFTIDNGQRNEFYDLARISVKPAYASRITSSTRMLVELDHFTANTSASVGFFSVESYPIDDANTANTTAITSIELPKFENKELRNFIDFRPRKANSAASSTSEGSATVNPVALANTFTVPAGGQYLIAPDVNFQADFEFYLPRYDLLALDPSGNFILNKGTPSTSPRPPFVENDQSAVAECFVPPYPSPTFREFETYKTAQYIKINIKTNKRYTMRDIGTLEERIKRLEYYVVLSSLEQQARDMTIPDSSGLDRFKNGIFADPFNSHNLGNVSDFEYKIAIDSNETVARPYIQRHDIDFQFVPNTSSDSLKSSNVVQKGQLVMLNYGHESYIQQRFATKFRVVTESAWQWNGLLELYPSYDFFRDETYVPNVNVNLDFSTAWEEFANSPWGSIFGDWRTVNSTTASSTDVNSVSGGTLATTTTTTTQTQEQIVRQLQVDTITQTIDLGSYVKDVSMQPYMRSRLVAFISNSQKPNTRLHAFFDDVNVDAHCAPGVLSGITNVQQGLEDRVVSQSGAFGSALNSNANGFCCGIFRIPAQTFRTGDRVFMLTNVDDLTTGADARTSIGTAVYTADNLSVTKSSTTITTVQPKISTLSTTQQRLLTSSQTSSVFTPTVVPTPPDPTPWSGGDGGGNGDGGSSGDGGGDPMAQSFPIRNIPDTVTGVYITKVGLYFRSKDATVGCTVYICEMENNMPDTSRILGQCHLPASSISVSRGPDLGEPLVETQFELDYPVYLMSNREYAFVVYPDGGSPNYSIWISETGDFDITSGQQVFENAYNGVMFVSANQRTWTSIQKEDINFNIYRARFTATTGNVIFKNENDEYLTIDGFTRQNTATSVQVGDVVFTVNSSANISSVSSIVSNTITAGASGRVQYLDETIGELWLDSSTANSSSQFANTGNKTIAVYRLPNPSNTAQANSTTLVATANVNTVNNLKYHVVVPKFGVLQPSRTSIEYNFKGTSVTNSFDSNYTNITNEVDYAFDDVARHAMSRSNELASLSGAKSSIFNLTLSTESNFVSPAINLSRKSTLFVENLINNDANNEHTRYGSALSKYVSKKIVLKDGQEAEDLKLFLTAYRPNETDIKVYVKFKNGEDPEPFDDKVWTLLQYDNDGDLVYSSPTNSRDFIEYEFSVPSLNAVATAAFANVDVVTESPLTGTITIANNSNIITGTGTAFNTELSVGTRIRVVSNTYMAVRTITNIANSTQLTVDNGLQAANSAALFYVFNTVGNDGIVEYKNSGGSRYIGYKEFAVKIVLLSSNPIKVPRLNDVRAIALQI